MLCSNCFVSGNTTTNELRIFGNETVQGCQICFDIAVVDDDLVESMEMAVICGCSSHNVTFNGCFNLTIEDNDGEINLNQTL